MFQLILIIIFILPLLVFSKFISKLFNISFFLTFIFLLTWSIATFLYYVKAIDSLLIVFLSPFISYICSKIVIKIMTWTFKTILDE